jgi:hypothetical protein
MNNEKYLCAFLALCDNLLRPGAAETNAQLQHWRTNQERIGHYYGLLKWLRASPHR